VKNNHRCGITITVSKKKRPYKSNRTKN